MGSQPGNDKKKYDSGIFKKPKLPPAKASSSSTPQIVQKPLTIGASPIPGIKLKTILKGHTKGVNRVTISPDGKYLASPSDDKTIHIWDEGRGELVAVLAGHTASVTCAQYSPNGKLLASCSADTQIIIWNVEQKKIFKQLSGHTNQVNSVAWSSNSEFLASGSTDGTIRIWNTTTWQTFALFNIEDIKPAVVTDLIWITDQPTKLASVVGHNPSTVIIWDIDGKKRDWSFGISQGFTNRISYLAERGILFSGGDDKTVYAHDLRNRKALQHRLEGHTSSINGITCSPNGKLLATISENNTIRLWNADSLESLASWNEGNKSSRVFNVLEFHPYLAHLITLGTDNTNIFIWKFDERVLLRKGSIDSVKYTTAKLVLVGDSGVGKTGLGWRLSHGVFKEHASTHGQQFWVIPELGEKRNDGTECEAVLWDLAGQHVYRPIHSIFLDNVDTALVLFDPSNRQDPLKGAQFWLEQLKGTGTLPPSVLVGARIDRGAPVLSYQELEQVCQQYGISGGYIGTSAKSGEGLVDLVEKIKTQIPWDRMTTTVTTLTFKRIKDYIKLLKENPNRKGVLLKPEELKQRLETSDRQWIFNEEEMMTAVGHLANLGYIVVLNDSSGEQYILLVPELLASVAASIFLFADKHPRELGSISETDLLQGRYPFDELKGLDKEEQQVLLDASVVRFLEHNICFRESYGSDHLLIFPSLIKQKRPLRDDIPSTDDISYIVRGRVENIYATLSVLLGYTTGFTRINQWQNQTQYETEAGNICGFRLVEDREGEIELILYYGNTMPIEKRNDFQTIFEQFLYQREVDVTPFPPIACPNGHRQERSTVVKRLRDGKESLFCDECGAKTLLPNLNSQKTIGIEASDWLVQEEAIARLRSIYETHLVRVKGYRRGWETPRCYISHVDEQSAFAGVLAHDLNDAGIFVIDDSSKVKPDDIVILLDSPSYKQAWQAMSLQQDMALVKPRLTNKKLISIVVQGKIVGSHDITSCKPGDFRDATHYPVGLFDLILNLYAIPLGHAGFTTLRQSLHEQWERTLAQTIKSNKTTGSLNLEEDIHHKEIFISYAWGGESEKLVNDIDRAFQSNGVIITRDKRDMAYRGRIKEFMERLGQGKSIIVVISDKYLKSKHCMFELIQIAQNQRFKNRVFPIVLNDANIYDAVKRLDYVKYWENKINELDTAMKSVNAANLQGFREEIDLFDSIRRQIAKLTDTLQDMNTYTTNVHREAEFKVLFNEVMEKLEN